MILTLGLKIRNILILNQTNKDYNHRLNYILKI